MKHESANNLYFISILQEAFQNEDRKDALIKAIDEIKLRSSKPEYQEGYQNFLTFIRAIESELLSDRDARDNSEYSALSEQAIDIMTGIFEGTAREKLEILALFEQDIDHEALKQIIGEFTDVDYVLAVEIRKGEVILASCRCDGISLPLVLSEITPGSYAVQLSNGRQIWSENLKDRDVRWRLAFPDQKYPAAALTEPAIAKSSISASLLGGSLLLEVIPGIESATMRISMTSGGSK